MRILAKALERPCLSRADFFYCDPTFIETIEPDRVKTIEKLNKEYAVKVLEMFGDNKAKAAEVLGISRTSLWRILKEE